MKQGNSTSPLTLFFFSPVVHSRRSTTPKLANQGPFPPLPFSVSLSLFFFPPKVHDESKAGWPRSFFPLFFLSFFFSLFSPPSLPLLGGDPQRKDRLRPPPSFFPTLFFPSPCGARGAIKMREFLSSFLLFFFFSFSPFFFSARRKGAVDRSLLFPPFFPFLFFPLFSAPRSDNEKKD